MDRNAYPIAAIWITGPSENITAADIPKIGADFKSAALRISAILGFDATMPRIDARRNKD